MEDKTLTCQDCKADFVFSAGEQEFYAERDLSAPLRCKDCRAKKKTAFKKEMHSATCAECGAECTVPFKPNGLKPVLCRDCFSK
jgi:CxxC-x17-CxxC domain-containing protein